NLHYNYFRSYSAERGRYTQADPIGLDGGFNRFGYVGGNSLSFIDIFGLASTERTQGLLKEFYECMAALGLDSPNFRPRINFDPNLPALGETNVFSRKITLNSSFYNDGTIFSKNGSIDANRFELFANTLIHEGVHVRESIFGVVARGLLDLAGYAGIGEGHGYFYNLYSDGVMDRNGGALLNCVRKKRQGDKCD
ncbi:RHS repeat-associated core domain-containing protein, partial [Acidovorax sp. CF316]|uniref:RHS repeat-associated core domain-containing protein n=1 Tax=Acidovorax sp. CF316 TaxID=1144317 RepID=UPI00138B089F